MEQSHAAILKWAWGCATYIWDIYTRNKKLYATALEHYTKAYEQMDRISDRWHWRSAASQWRRYICSHTMMRVSTAILCRTDSHGNFFAGHLVTIYRLQHDFDFRLQHFDKALKHYKASEALEDDVRGVQKANRYIDLRLNFEQDKNTRSLQRIRLKTVPTRCAGRLPFIWFSLPLPLRLSSCCCC